LHAAATAFTVRRIAGGLALTVAVGCGTQPPARQEPDLADARPTAVTTRPTIVGHWALDMSPEPDTPTARIWLELDIDSVSAGRLFGRLTNYLAGDVGIDPSVFPRFDGALTDDAKITIRIGHADTLISGFVLRGTVGTDTIPMDLFVVGPDTVSGGPRRWALVRRR
jgi:hypothetical protein